MSLDATHRQNTASRPGQSSWVSANAGSGKTRVLTDRVARLLLAGNAPQKILCLTYTKAAAAEMQNRLFGRLGEWAMMPDDALREALDRIGEKGSDYSDAALRKTRTHFARALETPGGLKIQTIHAFCASLLRRFPTEAGVSPQFREIEDGQAVLLREQVLEDMARDDDTRAFDALARNLTDERTLDALLLDILKHKEEFGPYDRAEFAHILGCDANHTRSEIIDNTLGRIGFDQIAKLGETLALSSGKKDPGFASLLKSITTAQSHELTFKILQQVFLTEKLTPRSRNGFPVKPIVAAHPWLSDEVDRVTALVVDTLDQLRRLNALNRSQDLHHFANVFLARYAQEKHNRGLLDFEDLIDNTISLLSTREMTAWVLYRIDNGIEHILVDEAQDTSPKQWKIVEALTQEFTDGKSAAAQDRTIFVVGDKKQSIFGFQGAAPDEFIRMEQEYQARFEQVRKPFQSVELPTSFRSAAPILSLVDKVFQDDEQALGGPPAHVSLSDIPGRVELWPFDENEKNSEKKAWYEPVDTISDNSKVVLLAKRIAQKIDELIGQPLHTKAGTRKVTPGDFLVLVRSRNVLFHTLIDELKVREISVAGADRMRVSEQLAVRDLTSLMRFLDNDRDDLSLAEALRSPVFDISQQTLFTLAHGRKGSLWAELRRSDLPARDILIDLRKNLDFVRPYELLERVLTHHGGRQRLIARLGPQCEDPIDELLAQALAFETMEAPSLGAFIHWLSARNVELKRDMESGLDQVRVMTVHGAKGLEAPIVFLPDSTQFEAHRKRPPIDVIGGKPVWTSKSEEDPAILKESEDLRRLGAEYEYARLLYVALTRAENWLFVAGAGKRTNFQHRWHTRVETAMRQLGASENEDGSLVLSHKWEGAVKDVPAPDTRAVTLPDWAHNRAKPGPKPQRSVSPSDFDAPHALPGETTQDGRQRGDVVHRLLEVLPTQAETKWLELTQRIAGNFAPEALLEEVISVLKNPDLAQIFDPTALIEVPILAELPERGITISGRIDRLIVRDDRVLAVDFKSNRIVPETAAQTPLGILAQQGAYAAGLAQIYPDRRIDTAIIWTKTAQFMQLAHDDVIAALNSVTQA